NISKSGEVIESFETKIINSSICSQSTLSKVRSMLEGVVDYGTGKAAASKTIKIAGKTGTAQIGYKNNRPEAHLLTFCGYFPADNPLYSCIVSIKVPNRGYSHSAGATSGIVFKNIAEQIYAQKVRLTPNEFSKTCEVEKSFPSVKNGDFDQTKVVLKELDLNFALESKKSAWVQCCTADSTTLVFNAMELDKNEIPNVVGMGAKDAVFLIEKCGVRACISGTGKVVSQSIAAGTKPQKGNIVYLNLK
ncbi:MAG: PASTA domain-containing protein, partial [Paludibacteraceae bacterium]|nr:PASTA domain-containing protein [Paludibacteraceae bacterium]